MAINKSSKVSPTIQTGTSSPNTLQVKPEKVGDLFIDTSNLKLYFATDVTASTNNWGTS